MGLDPGASESITVCPSAVAAHLVLLGTIASDSDADALAFKFKGDPFSKAFWQRKH